MQTLQFMPASLERVATLANITSYAGMLRLSVRPRVLWRGMYHR